MRDFKVVGVAKAILVFVPGAFALIVCLWRASAAKSRQRELFKLKVPLNKTDMCQDKFFTGPGKCKLFQHFRGNPSGFFRVIASA